MEMQSSAASMVSSTKNVMSLDDKRRSMTSLPTIWGDYFLAYTADNTEISSAEQEELERQKEIIRELLAQIPDDSVHKIKLIDAIQRLGVSYHFEKEIDKSLQYVHDIHYAQHNSKDNDLRVVALLFRLLRQQGYNVPCDVFSKFIDNEGNFKESSKDDVEGMLNLYEAAYLGRHGEEILDKAIDFCSSHLESSRHQMSNSLSTRVDEALKIPVRKGMTRFGARKFISMYQEDESHNKILLNFAKLDFNMVQKIHQKELSDVTRWWKSLDIANKLPYTRDRIVECYFWIVGVYFEPHYNIARRMLTKVLALASIVDDTYGYATLDELQLLTDTIQRWDDVNALEESPPHIRICYRLLLDVYAEMEDEMEKAGRSYCVRYAKEDMKKLVKAYFEEAKWLYNEDMPTMEEYMKVALVSAGYMMMSTSSLVGMGDLVTKKDFDWISSEPVIVRASSVIARVMDDLVGEGYEEKTSSVHCYMNQYGASKMEAFAELRKQVKNAWKDINQECLESRAVSMPILIRLVNLACVINLLYANEDGFSNPTKTKDFVKCVLIEPLSTMLVSKAGIFASSKMLSIASHP